MVNRRLNGQVQRGVLAELPAESRRPHQVQTLGMTASAWSRHIWNWTSQDDSVMSLRTRDCRV